MFYRIILGTLLISDHAWSFNKPLSNLTLTCVVKATILGLNTAKVVPLKLHVVISRWLYMQTVAYAFLNKSFYSLQFETIYKSTQPRKVLM